MPTFAGTRTGLIAVIVLLAATSPCFALHLIHPVSVEDAKKLGVTIQAAPNGDAGTRVIIEFKAEGPLKEYRHVQVRVRKENGQLSATLKAWDKEGVITADFSGDAETLAGSTFTIVVWEDPFTWIDYQFAVKDFIAAKVP